MPDVNQNWDTSFQPTVRVHDDGRMQVFQKWEPEIEHLDIINRPVHSVLQIQFIGGASVIQISKQTLI